jgi:hypothetical protein
MQLIKNGRTRLYFGPYKKYGHVQKWQTEDVSKKCSSRLHQEEGSLLVRQRNEICDKTAEKENVDNERMGNHNDGVSEDDDI